MKTITILILSITLPLIIYYRINYGRMKDIMLKNSIGFTGTINNVKNLYVIFKVLKDKKINNRDRIFLMKMLISVTLSIVFLLFYTIVLYLFPEFLFND